MDLLAQVFLSLAQNKPAHAKEVIKGELVARVLAGETIPDHFWLQLLSLDINLVKDVLPETWKPSQSIWALVLLEVSKKNPTHVAFFQLLLDKYPETFCFTAVSYLKLPLLSQFKLKLSSSNIFHANADISKEHLVWLMNYSLHLFRSIIRETGFRQDCFGIIVRDPQLLNAIEDNQLLEWLNEGKLTKQINGQIRFDLILPRIIPLLKQPWYQHSLIEQALLNYMSDTQEHYLIIVLSRLFPKQYMEWFRIGLLGVDTYGVKVDGYPKDSKMFNHCRLLAKQVELQTHIDGRLELELFCHFELRRHLDREKYQWPFILSLCNETPPDNQVFNTRRIPEARQSPEETRRMSIQSALSSYFFSPDETKPSLILELISRRDDSYGGFGSYSHLVPWEITKALLKKFDARQKTGFIRLIIRSGNPDVLRHILAEEDVSKYLTKQDLPPSGASDDVNWTYHLTKLHPENVDSLVELTKGTLAFSGIMALHPRPSLELLAEALMVRVIKFKTMHLSDEDLDVLERMTILADKPALKTIKAAKQKRQKASLNKHNSQGTI